MKIERRFSFQICEIRVGGLYDGLYVGRNCGQDIPINSIFATIIKQIYPSKKQFRDSVSEKIVMEKSNIVLNQVHCYGKKLDFIPEGYTAGLELLGNDEPLLRELVLSLKEHEYICIETSNGN